MNMPLGVAWGVLYVLLVAISIWAESRFFVFWMALIGTVLTFAGYYLSPEGSELWKVIANRGLALFGIWLAVYFVSKRSKLLYRLKKSNAALNKLRSSLEVQVAQRTFELAERDGLLEDVLDTTDIAFLLVNPMGDVRMSNRSACSLFGCNGNAMVGWNVKSLFKTGQEAEIDYLLSGRSRSEVRSIPSLQTSNDKGDIFGVTVEARPTRGRVTDALLLSITKTG